MISDKMKELVNNNSVIRQMFEEGKRLENIYGKENVFDFSLGNPSVPAPEKINQIIKDIVNSEDSNLLHGYMSNSGFEDVRGKIANSINKRFDTEFSYKNIIMTVGAASGLNIVLKSILNPGEEVIVFAPYFLEYRNYVKNYDGKIVEVLCNEKDFMPDLEKFEESINKNTRAVIINSPNNPSGAIYDENTIKTISEILNKKQKEFESTIFIISDEPYRELVYDDIKVPYITNYYDNSIVCYSFSKSLSLPGERIGYIIVNPKCIETVMVYKAIAGAARSLGYVCAPSLFQYMIPNCLGKTSDINIYKENRDILYKTLSEYGYDLVKPEGAFYLFMKSLDEDAMKFSELAKKYELLLVPSDSFGYPGYIRISYCVSKKQIIASLPAFKKLIEEYKESK